MTLLIFNKASGMIKQQYCGLRFQVKSTMFCASIVIALFHSVTLRRGEGGLKLVFL